MTLSPKKEDQPALVRDEGVREVAREAEFYNLGAVIAKGSG